MRRALLGFDCRVAQRKSPKLELPYAIHRIPDLHVALTKFPPPPFAGSTKAAQLDAECAESVHQASDQLPSSFGGRRGGDDMPPPPLEGSFKTRLLAVFLSALISRRMVGTCAVLWSVLRYDILIEVSWELDDVR